MARLERVSFLVVDDNVHMVNIIKTILRGFGAQKIQDARDATEAFDRLRNDVVDVVILDYQMHVLDGIEFVRMVRNSSDSVNRFVPIVMLTAHSERARVTSARDCGVTEFCTKPVTANELYRKIQAIVNMPRPFVKVTGYFGPDRRRRTSKVAQANDRRCPASISHKAPDHEA